MWLELLLRFLLQLPSRLVSFVQNALQTSDCFVSFSQSHRCNRIHQFGLLMGKCVVTSLDSTSYQPVSKKRRWMEMKKKKGWYLGVTHSSTWLASFTMCFTRLSRAIGRFGSRAAFQNATRHRCSTNHSVANTRLFLLLPAELRASSSYSGRPGAGEPNIMVDRFD